MREREVRIAGDEILVLRHAGARVSRALRGGRALRRRAGRETGDRRAGGRFSARRVRRHRAWHVVRSRSGATLALIAVGVVPTVLETWDLAAQRAGAARRSARRYLATLVGEDSIDLDVQLARPVPGARRSAARARRARALLAPARRTFASSSGKGWLLNSHLCDSETGIVPIGGRVYAARPRRRADRILRRRERPADRKWLPGVGVVHAAFWKRWHSSFRGRRSTARDDAPRNTGL